MCQFKGIEFGIELGNMKLLFIETNRQGYHFKMRPVWLILFDQDVFMLILSSSGVQP